MGEIRQQRPVLLITAVSSRYENAIENWTRESAVRNWGGIVLESPLFDFDETSFYTKTMGADLKKKLFAFEHLVDPSSLSAIKLQSNEWEHEYKSTHNHLEERPLNIDPGYLTEAKLVLATTKDRDHRIYLKDGIFAEVTLFMKQGAWHSSRWTYPDYKRADFHQFFNQCRQYLRNRYASMHP